MALLRRTKFGQFRQEAQATEHAWKFPKVLWFGVFAFLESGTVLIWSSDIFIGLL